MWQTVNNISAGEKIVKIVSALACWFVGKCRLYCTNNYKLFTLAYTLDMRMGFQKLAYESCSETNWGRQIILKLES